MAKLRITKEDITNAGSFWDCKNCIAATALKRRFGSSVDFSVNKFTVGDKQYKVLNEFRPVKFYYQDDTIDLRGKPFTLEYKRVA